MTTPRPDTNRDETASLLMSFTRSLHQHVRAASPGYSFPSMKTMLIVREHDHPTMKEIAEELGVSPPAATAIIDRLVDDGELNREEDPNDRRMVRIALTSRGKSSLEKATGVWHDAIETKLSALSKSDRETFKDLLCRLNTVS